MKFLKMFLSFFTTITVGIVIVCTVNVMLSSDSEIPAITMLQILLAGFATALVTTIFYYKDITSNKKLIMVIVIHYVLLCVIMIGLGVWFDWMKFSLNGILMMVISVAAVYAMTFGINFILAKKDADAINKALEQRNKRR